MRAHRFCKLQVSAKSSVVTMMKPWATNSKQKGLEARGDTADLGRGVPVARARQQDIAIYVGSFPYRSHKLDRIRCLRYHIESYFHEAYMLRERLKSYTKVIERSFGKDNRRATIQRATRSARTISIATLDGVSATRSVHVHRARFDPRNLSKLHLLRLLSSSDDLPSEVADFYRLEFRRLRSEWKGVLRKNNGEIDKLLDTVAASLLGALFDSSRGRFKYPRANAAM